MSLRKTRAVSLLLAGLLALPALSSCGERTENADEHNESAVGPASDVVQADFRIRITPDTNSVWRTAETT